MRITRKHAIIIAVIIISFIILFLMLRKRSKYVYPDASPASADTTSYNTMTAALTVCASNYGSDLLNNPTQAEAIKASCIQSAVKSFLTSSCPYATGTIPNTGTELTKYNEYAVTSGTNHLSLLQAQYNDITQTPTPPGITKTIANAARKADITGATRRYLASVCSRLYVPTTSTGTADPTTAYTGWSPTVAAATGGGSDAYGFNSTQMKANRDISINGARNNAYPYGNIVFWAAKAATPMTLSTATSLTGGITTATLTFASAFDTAKQSFPDKATFAGTVPVGAAPAAHALAISIVTLGGAISSLGLPSGAIMGKIVFSSGHGISGIYNASGTLVYPAFTYTLPSATFTGNFAQSETKTMLIENANNIYYYIADVTNISGTAPANQYYGTAPGGYTTLFPAPATISATMPLSIYFPQTGTGSVTLSGVTTSSANAGGGTLTGKCFVTGVAASALTIVFASGQTTSSVPLGTGIVDANGTPFVSYLLPNSVTPVRVGGGSSDVSGPLVQTPFAPGNSSGVTDSAPMLFNWQIAQVIGPGTTTPATSAWWGTTMLASGISAGVVQKWLTS